MMRPLADHERLLIRLFAEKLPENEQRQLLADLAVAGVISEIADGEVITFCLEGYERPPYRGQHVYRAEGEMGEGDTMVTILLFADENDRLLELEYIRWNETAIIDTSWSGLRIFLTPTPQVPSGSVRE